MIHDAGAIAQEVLHSTKIKHILAVVIKENLLKVYDRVNYNFLKLVFLQVGFRLEVVN